MRAGFWGLAILVLGYVVAACAPSGPDAAVATPVSVPTILPTPASVVSYDERLQATIPIQYPDEIVSVDGFIWVKTDDGRVVQVDPASDSVIAELKVDTATDPNVYCQGLSTDSENIWACSARGDEDQRTIDVVRIDPVSKAVVATVPVNKVFDQFEMPLLNGRIWVLTGSGGALVGIDVSTNQPGAPIGLEARCFQLAVLDDALLASCALDGVILRIDPRTGETVSRVPIDDPRFLAVGADAVWVAQHNAVVRLDPQSLAAAAVFTGLGPTSDIYAGEDALWVRQDSGSVYRINPATNQIVEQVRVEAPLSGGSLLVTSDALWTTAADDDVLIHLSR